MDMFVVLAIALIAYLGGAWSGYRDGRNAGRAEEAARRRIAELPKPWERA